MSSTFSWKYKPSQLDTWYNQIVSQNQNTPLNGVVSQNKDLVILGLSNYFNKMHQYAFNELKSVIHDKAKENLEELKLDKDFFEENIVNLETEYSMGNGFEYLGIEPKDVIDYFVKGQVDWYSKNFDSSFYKTE